MPSPTRPSDELPLCSRTSAAWAAAALAEPLALLADHAHLERKAASNALALLPRWPRGGGGGASGGASGSAAADDGAGRWASVLAGVARDESEHLALVLRLLHERGGRLSRHHVNPYAAGLHALVRTGRGSAELLDRLLVSALIEARSCERFAALAAAAAEPALRALYRGLLASERGHARAFLRLAELVAQAREGQARLRELLPAEAAVLAAQAPGPRMHSGEPGAPAPAG